MFHDTLLDSSPSRRNPKRWPMATAFALESIGAVVAVIIPLLSTGVIPVTDGFRGPVLLPIVKADVRPAPASSGQNSAPRSSGPAVVAVNTNADVLRFGHATYSSENDPGPNPNFTASSGNGLDLGCNTCESGVKPGHDAKPFLISHFSEAQLIRRIEPVYPRPAVLMNLQGEVQLHAIIAKDGTIQSLSVTSGHPLLAQAALDAVRLWRYRPYVLNGEPVEVETFITVNFRRGR